MANTKKYDYYLGIDPGQKGAIAVLNANGELIKVINLGEYQTKVWGFTVFNPKTLAQDLVQIVGNFNNCVCLCERVNAYEQGRNSAFNFGANSLGLYLFLSGLGAEVFNSPPTQWKKQLEVDSSNLSNGVKLKDLSSKKAGELFPYWNFKETKTSDEEEAALLAYLCYLNSQK